MRYASCDKLPQLDLFIQFNPEAKLPFLNESNPSLAAVSTVFRPHHRIGNMTSLFTVDFSNNHLHDKSFPPEMANCTRLRQIKINDNRLTKIPEEITMLENLVKVEAKQNRICSLIGERGRRERGRQRDREKD